MNSNLHINIDKLTMDYREFQYKAKLLDKDLQEKQERHKKEQENMQRMMANMGKR